MLGECVCVLILVKDLLFSVPLRRVNQHTCQHSLKHTQTHTPRCPAIYHRFEKGWFSPSHRHTHTSTCTQNKMMINYVDVNNKDGERQRQGHGKSVDGQSGVAF